jgi:nicotinamide mononucleotide (NMN) deamidase PncC
MNEAVLQLLLGCSHVHEVSCKAGLIRRETAAVKGASLFVRQNVVAFISACNISTLSRAHSQSVE